MLNSKNYFLVFVFCVLSNAIISQNIEGFITYKTIFGADEIYDKMDYEEKKTIKDFYENQVLTLEFNSTECVFYQDTGMNLDNMSQKTDAFYYSNISDPMYVQLKDDLSLGKITVVDSIKSKWKFSNEMKIIGDFICYKATQTLKIDRGNYGKFEFPIIVWFTPQIPVPFGLFEYGKLPGLILELQIRNVVYGAEKIVFKLPAKSKLSKPKIEGKILTEKQYENLIISIFTNE